MDKKKELKQAGFRVTGARLAVLDLLEEQDLPVGISFIEKKLTEINTVTLYRMMADFVEAGIVEEHDLGHGHVDYELTSRPHHHHVVCDKCGLVEDVFPCGEVCEFENSVLKDSNQFSKITKQKVTFHGICNKCA